MSAVGLDIGSDGIIVGVVRNRGIEVLQNEVGKRITPNIVAYSGKQRLLGDQAIGQFMSNPKNSIKYARRLLGLKYDDPDLKYEKPFLTYKVDKTKEGGIAIDVNYDDNRTVFTPEQVVATTLTRAKVIAEAGLGKKVQEVVIGIPFFWTDRQRRALLDAAAIAGLNVLRLMHETTAVALSYGILRPLPEKETRYVLFIDLGLASYQVSLVSFTAGKELKVIATEYDKHFGARNVDQLLANHFAKYIKQKYNMDVLSEPKATLKLFKECDKVKTVLSANSSAEFHVEYIMNDKDVSGSMERTEFEALVVSNFFEKIIGPVKRVFESAAAKELKLTKDNIHSVEIVGGGARIPVIQKTLKEYLGKELGKTCDSDESVARGCALQCAMLSRHFKVKEFAVNDIYPFAIDVSWGPVPNKDSMDVEPSKPTTLFPKFQAIQSVKSLTFPDRTEPFQIVAKFNDPSVQPDPFIGRWVVGGIPKVEPGKQAPKVKVFIKLDVSGVFSVSSAHHIEEYWVDEPVEPAKTEPKKDEPKADGKDKEKEAPKSEPEKEKEKETGEEDKPKAKKEAKKGKKKSPKSGEEDKPKKKGKAKSGEKKSKKKSKDEAKPMEEESATEKPAEKPAEEPKDGSTTPGTPATKKKKKTRRVDLKVDTLVTSNLPEKDIKEYTEKEVHMAQQDRIVEETGEARNALESYVLDTRSKLQDESELQPYVKEHDAKGILESLKNAEEWLEGDGFDAQKSEYVSRLEELKKKGDPVYRRKKEAEGRGEYVEKLKSAIGRYSNFASSTDEKYSHIEDAEKKKVAKLANEIDQWLAQSLSKQDRIAKTDDPFLTVKLLQDKLETLEKEGDPIMNKPKPKPKEEPKKEEPKKDEAKDGAKKEEPKKEEPKDDGKDKEKEQVSKKAKTADKDSSAKMDTS